MEQGLTAHQAGRVEAALDAYNKVLAIFDVLPDDNAIISTLSAVHGNKGAIYMSTGDYDNAREAFQSACLVSPSNAMAQFNLAVILTSKFGNIERPYTTLQARYQIGAWKGQLSPFDGKHCAAAGCPRRGGEVLRYGRSCINRR